MEKLRKFFDKGFFILFFILSGVLIFAYFLKGLILGKFPGVDELNLFYNFNPLFFIKLPAVLHLSFFINIFDISSLFFILIIFKIIREEIEENFPERMIRKVWLVVFLAIIIGGFLSYFLGIIISLIIAIIIALLFGLSYSIFVEKNLVLIDLIINMSSPFFLISISMIMGVGVIYGLTIPIYLLLLFFILIFSILMIYFIINILITWIIKIIF
jgi:hypothetical protein